eukprot:TRINITY_DN2626_c0_g1_i5.p1 TRINITY_DN2626_c0_g1~~TRINITY_DN2626_c0_g1_i5.p1  ORF type:complete len:359 (-),score=67.57 TRINITY_DN2626_c0_g1_i5:1019-2095(-)
MCIRDRIEDIVIKTICSIQPSLAHLYKSCISDDIDGSCCFEILGFDILLDKDLNVWLLEVNHSPSFSTDTPLDWKIKGNLVADTLMLLNMTQKKKKLYLQNKKRELKRRIFCKSTKEHLDEKLEYRAKKYRIRTKFELTHLGGYKLIFPQPEVKREYELCLEKADEMYSSFIGAAKKSEHIPRSDSLKRPDTVSMPKRQESHKPKAELLVKRPSTVKDSTRQLFDIQSSRRPAKGDYTTLANKVVSGKLPKLVDKEHYNFTRNPNIANEATGKVEVPFGAQTFIKEGNSVEGGEWLTWGSFKGKRVCRNTGYEFTCLDFKGCPLGSSQQVVINGKALDRHKCNRKSTHTLTQAMFKRE